MNYNSLINKPTLNHKELIGNNSASDIGGMTEEQFAALLNTDLASYYTKAQIDDLFSRSYVYREKSGSIVTFDCPASVNGIDKVVSEIVAVQSGTGDPSPTNVRPISGWSAVNVYRTGINAWDEETANGYWDGNTGEFVESGNWMGCKNYIACKPSTSYYFLMGTVATGSLGRVCFYDNNKSFISSISSSWGNNSVTTPSNAYFMTFYANPNYFVNNISINYPSTDTDYHAYNGTTYTTTLKDGQGNTMTCYGGTLSNENGVQRLDNGKVSVDLSEVTAVYNSGWNCWVIQASELPNAKIIDSNNTPTTAMTDRFKAVKASGYSSSHESNTIAQNTSGLWFIDNGSTTELSGQLVYELATTQLIPQDSLSIATQDGTNNLWADSGDITVKALDNILQG